MFPKWREYLERPTLFILDRMRLKQERRVETLRVDAGRRELGLDHRVARDDVRFITPIPKHRARSRLGDESAERFSRSAVRHD